MYRIGDAILNAFLGLIRRFGNQSIENDPDWFIALVMRAFARNEGTGAQVPHTAMYVKQVVLAFDFELLSGAHGRFARMLETRKCMDALVSALLTMLRQQEHSWVSEEFLELCARRVQHGSHTVATIPMAVAKRYLAGLQSDSEPRRAVLELDWASLPTGTVAGNTILGILTEEAVNSDSAINALKVARHLNGRGELEFEWDWIAQVVLNELASATHDVQLRSDAIATALRLFPSEPAVIASAIDILFRQDAHDLVNGAREAYNQLANTLVSDLNRAMERLWHCQPYPAYFAGHVAAIFYVWLRGSEIPRIVANALLQASGEKLLERVRIDVKIILVRDFNIHATELHQFDRLELATEGDPASV